MVAGLTSNALREEGNGELESYVPRGEAHSKPKAEKSLICAEYQ